MSRKFGREYSATEALGSNLDARQADETRKPDPSPMRLPLLAMSAALVLTYVGMPARATSVYDYKPKEYVTVDGGLAPNKRLSIAANGYRSFHVYLMAEPAHKPIAALASIDNDAILDTGPSAYHAVWSADSRHVAMHFRSDRHVLTMLLYAIRNGRPRLLDVPMLFGLVTKLPETAADFEIKTDYAFLAWQSATTFTATQDRLVEVKAPDLAQKLGAYGRPDMSDAAQRGADANTPPVRHFMNFSAVASGEVLPGGGIRIIELKPGKFD
jgi:hypothetical protein